MLDTKLYADQLLSEFTKDQNTGTVEIRCSLPATFLTVSVLDDIKEGVQRTLEDHQLTVQSVRFAEESPELGSKDFFIKVTKA